MEEPGTREHAQTGRADMPAWQGKLSEQEIDNVVTWITSLWSDAVYMEWKTKAERPAP